MALSLKLQRHLTQVEARIAELEARIAAAPEPRPVLAANLALLQQERDRLLADTVVQL